MSKIRIILTKISDVVFPPKCAGCGEIAGKIICDACFDQIKRRAMWRCHKCGAPPYMCRCKRIGYIAELVFPYFYDGDKLKFAIFKLKRANLYYINEFFAKSMYNSVLNGDKINLEEIDFFTCVPRVRKSLTIYGYNHAENLARLIAKYSEAEFKRTLKCKQFAGIQREQKTLARSERAENVSGKFAIHENADIIGKNIILVDDVATSGATLSECAKMLKEAGANRIYALCAASTLG